MDTAVIQIGNTDDKLPQKRWSHFVTDVQNVLRNAQFVIHFAGASPSSAPWQNTCWVVELGQDNYDLEARVQVLRALLSEMAGKYDQDSIALTLGTTEFVRP